MRALAKVLWVDDERKFAVVLARRLAKILDLQKRSSGEQLGKKGRVLIDS